MFERFDESARRVVEVAGNIAAERERAKGAGDFPRNVRVRVSDLRQALRLTHAAAGWAGGFDRYATARLERLRETEGSITVEELTNVLQ